MQSRILDKTFLTGCDEKTQWQLDLFLRKFLEFEHKTKLIVCDFGMTEDVRNQVINHKAVDCVMNLNNEGPETGWFLKPTAMLHCPSNATVWLDTDCEIKENIDDIFDKLDAKRVQKLVTLVTQDYFGQVMVSDTDEDRMKALLNSLNVPSKLFEVVKGDVTEISR